MNDLNWMVKTSEVIFDCNCVQANFDIDPHRKTMNDSKSHNKHHHNYFKILEMSFG